MPAAAGRCLFHLGDAFKMPGKIVILINSLPSTGNPGMIPNLPFNNDLVFLNITGMAPYQASHACYQDGFVLPPVSLCHALAPLILSCMPPNLADPCHQLGSWHSAFLMGHWR